MHPWEIYTLFIALALGLFALGAVCGVVGFIRWMNRRAAASQPQPPNPFMEEEFQQREQGTCETCRWHMCGNAYDSGECRRLSPHASGFPTVAMDDWCGSYTERGPLKFDREP